MSTPFLHQEYRNMGMGQERWAVLCGRACAGWSRHLRVVYAEDRLAVRQGIVHHWIQLAHRGNHRGLLAAIVAQRRTLANLGRANVVGEALRRALGAAVNSRHFVTMDKLLVLLRPELPADTLMQDVAQCLCRPRVQPGVRVACLRVLLQSTPRADVEHTATQLSRFHKVLQEPMQVLLGESKRWSCARASWIAVAVT